jgi:Mn-containing catalase
MPELRELFVQELQGLLDAETQLTTALPKMAEAANHPKLKEAFEKHLLQTQNHVERLRQIFGRLGEDAESKPCKAMQGLIEEGQEIINESSGKEATAADLALIAAAQKVEHYEIASYGTVRALARQLGDPECARVLSHTLGEEESADYLLTAIADPLIQQATLDEMGGNVNLDKPPIEERSTSAKKKKPSKSEKVA